MKSFPQKQLLQPTQLLRKSHTSCGKQNTNSGDANSVVCN